MRDITIHTAYAEATPKIPGEYMGTSSGYTRMNKGDIVTGVDRAPSDSYGPYTCDYYFDPEMLIEGSHFKWGGWPASWIGVYPESFVQVDYSGTLGGGKLYTYRDPSGKLRIGDEVEVPVTFGTKNGVVEALGRGDDWDGPCKDVAARITREAL